MRILWIGDACCSTGFARCSHAACDALHEAGHEVVVLGLNFFGSPSLSARYPYTIEPCYNPLDGGGDRFGLERFPVFVDRIKPDVVVMLQDAWNIPGYYELFDKWNRNRVSDGLEPTPEPTTIGWIACDAKNQRGSDLDRLAHVVAWTEFGRDEFIAGGYDGPMSIVGLGVDTDLFHPVDRAEARRAALGDSIPEDAFIVGVVGRNQERKRLDLTIEYFAKWIHEAGIEDAYLYLHIGPTGDQGCNLQSLVSYYGLGSDQGIGSGRVILSEPDIGVGIAEQSMRDLYGCFDLYWTTSMGEGWGLPATEAMACGVPCLLPNASAFSSWPGDAAAGVECLNSALVAPLHMHPHTIGSIPDRDDCIRSLDWLYRNPSARERFSKAGLELAAKLTWEASGEAFVRIVESAAVNKEAPVVAAGGPRGV